MDLIKRKTKLINFIASFLLLNFISKNICLLEFPIKIINPKNIPKYKDIQFETAISQNIQNIINSDNNPDFDREIKIFSESGDINFIETYLLSIQIKLGTSNQIFNLILDTGSTITWVPLIKSKDIYPISHHYNPSDSSSSKKLKEEFVVTYGSGSCYGSYYKDKIKYINNKEFEFVFGAAEATDFGVKEADGIIGLSKIYDDQSKSFIHMLCRNGVTTSKLFSFKLGLNITSQNTGKFYIGKHEDFNKDNVVSCEMKNSNYFERNFWACEMTSFSVLNLNKTIKLTSKKRVSLIFDSGTNAIFLPFFYIEEMKKDLQNMNCITIDSGIGNIVRYQLVCKGELLDFHLVIGGHTFILPWEYSFYIIGDKAFSKIFFQESYEDMNNIYIIGSPFFMLFHILFDSYSKELHFYPEKNEFLIKGSWWNTTHIIYVVIFGILIIVFIVLIILLILWKRKNKLNPDIKESFDINSLGVL